MESEPADAPQQVAVLEELIRREPIFHRLELGTSRADFELQTAPDFWEVGASGRIYGREHVWTILAERYAHPAEDPWETSDFRCRELAPGTYLLTYALDQDGRLSRRMTIWQNRGDVWRIVYHQGTLIEQP